MDRSTVRRRSKSVLLIIFAYLTIQSIMAILHEFAHSTSAWLLVYTPTPFTVVWGNPITTKGFDEGVPYDRLFPLPGNPAESVIGGIPLLIHASVIVLAMYALLRSHRGSRPLIFFGLYWLVVVNLAELVAYIIMRPFIHDGDTGRFNAGLNVSPWMLFTFGTAFLVITLSLLARRIGPMIDAVTDGSRLEHWTVIWTAGFIMFLWGSGIRMMSLYPDPQWTVGLVGVAAFLAWPLVNRSPATQRHT